MGGSKRTSAICVALALAAWLGNAFYALGAPGGALKTWSPALVAAAMIAFLVVHGRRRYSAAQLRNFAVIVFLVGWSFETVSILTGFPFGSYHYTDLMRPFLGHVPVSVMPAYCVMGYVSWSMARLLLRRTGSHADAVLRFGVPVLAALLMVVWDLSMDPLRATVEQRWVWLEGGAHYGVPVENYFGWALVTWVMFQAFALSLRRDGAVAPAPGYGRPALYWLSVPLMYAAFAVEYVLNPFVASAVRQARTVDAVGMPVGAVYADVALLAAATMLPLAAVAAIAARRAVPVPQQGQGRPTAALAPRRS